MMDYEWFIQMYSGWRIRSNYKDFKDFAKLYGTHTQTHRDSGGADMYYMDDFAWPFEDTSYLDYIVGHINLPIQNIKFEKCWWIDYQKESYSGVHRHQPGLQFTSVLFLNTYEYNEDWPQAGNLFLVHDKFGCEYVAPTAGDLVIMDGNVWHGTAPTKNERKVLVCDFSYEIGEI